MSLWSRYLTWHHKHKEGIQLTVFIVEFFVALGVVVEGINWVSEHLSRVDLSFFSYTIQISLKVGVLVLLFIGLSVLYFIIRVRVKKLRNKLTKAVSDFTGESTEAQTEINISVVPEISFSTDAKLSYPLKLYINIANLNEKTIIIDKVIFSASKNIKIHFPNNIHIGGDDYQPTLYLGKVNNQEKWANLAVMEPISRIKFFIPIEKDFGQVALQNSLNNKTTGTVVLRATMLSNELVTKDLRFDF